MTKISRMFSRLSTKISFKLFVITAITFTTLLVCALYAQNYFFQGEYLVLKHRRNNFYYSDLCNELRASDMEAPTVATILNTYKNTYNFDVMILLSDGVTEKYSRLELESEGYQYGKLLEEAFPRYLEDISYAFDKPHVYTDGNHYVSSAGVEYSIYAANALAGDDIVLAVTPYESYETPGLIEKYFVYVGVVGVIISVALSLVFSVMVTKPIVRINTIAKDMATLNFNTKIILTTKKHFRLFRKRISETSNKDELGQLAESLSSLSEKLDSTIKELSAANKKLEADIERERNLEKTRKEFVTNISHELRTPLAIIKGYGEALKDNIRVDKKTYYIMQIIRQADDMGKLIEDMLDLSRIENGLYKPQPTDFNLVYLAESVLDSFQSILDEKDLKLVRSYPNDDTSIHADRLKIGQVIANFFKNALHHTALGGSIYVSITQDAKNTRFEIENEGIRIDPEKLDKLWDRFYKAEEARSKKMGGIGLGLAISAKILQMHQMEYGAKNTERGVLFYFSLARYILERD